MWEIAEQNLIQFINMLPYLIPFVLVMNMVCDMLFGRN